MRVFVYGTLMNGFSNHSLFAGIDHTVNQASLEGYGLYQVSEYFPGIIKEPGSTVLGEVYEIDEEVLKRLDRLEGEGSLYLRKEVTVNTVQGEEKAYTYIWNHSADPTTRIPLSSQPWRSKRHNIWYACYGANMNKEYFFNKYINNCSDQTQPLASKQITIPYALYFARQSSRWDSMGVAFLDPTKDVGVETLGKMYLITQEQFEQIQSMEGIVWYDHKIDLGEMDGCKILTFTHSQKQRSNTPGNHYLSTIAEGLKQTYQFDEKMAFQYLEDHC